VIHICTKFLLINNFISQVHPFSDLGDFSEGAFFPSLLTDRLCLYVGLADEFKESPALDITNLTAKSQLWFLQNGLDHSLGYH